MAADDDRAAGPRGAAHRVAEELEALLDVAAGLDAAPLDRILDGQSGDPGEVERLEIEIPIHRGRGADQVAEGRGDRHERVVGTGGDLVGHAAERHRPDTAGHDGPGQLELRHGRIKRAGELRGGVEALHHACRKRLRPRDDKQAVDIRIDVDRVSAAPLRHPSLE